MYISDLDGTILNSQACLDDESVHRLNKMIKNGLKFTYVTSRDWSSSSEIMLGVDIHLPVAVCNGGVIIDSKSGEVVKVYCISADLAEKLALIAWSSDIFPNITLFHQNKVRTHYVAVQKRINRDSYMEKIRSKPESFLEAACIKEAIGENVVSIAFVDRAEKIYAFYETLKDINKGELCINLFCDPLDEKIRIIDITSALASKGIAASYIAGLCGMPLSNIIAFGNDLNDIELLKVAGIGIAVGNAPDKLKEVASIGINYNGGKSVLSYMEKHFY